MADNIINTGIIPNSNLESTDSSVAAELPDRESSEQFSGLLASNDRAEGGASSWSTQPPEQFSDLTIDEGSQSTYNSGYDRFSTNGPLTPEVAENHGVYGQVWSDKGTILGENTGSEPGEGTLGDKILRGMQGVREHVEQGARQVEAALEPASETMSMREMFQTQWTMSNLMITEDYIGKVVSKGTQAFDTLLRNQ